MVEARTELAARREAKRMAGRRRSALTIKLFRDIRQSAMQFVTIVLLCALGTWVFAGLDGSWRMIDASMTNYMTQCHMADLWVNASQLSKNDLDNLRNIEGVEQLQARFSTDMDCPELGDDVSLLVHAYDGTPELCTTVLSEGEQLAGSDKRGMLLDSAFAEAHGLHAGDRVKVRLNGYDMSFVVRGVVSASEHLMIAKDVTADPNTYGFAYISWNAVSAMPFTEALICVAEGADMAAVEQKIQTLLPEALLLDHHSQSSWQRSTSEVSIFKNLTLVFPVMAFAVAAMVVLTTLTRMIEKQRTQMGTLKALGYSDGQIRRHYLNYAFVPSAFGSLMGLFIGRYTLPDMLYAMETAHYTVPQKLRPPISWTQWIATGLMVLLSVLICLYTYNKQAKENTAALLRPKPPRAGSRILLERMTGVWSRFSFNTKMVVRSIARNKGRSLMAMVGLLCCNMLIICAMGLQDSIDTDMAGYYKQALHYDLRADVESGSGTLDGWRARLDAEAVEGVMEKSVSARAGGVSRTVLLNVTENDQTMLYLGKGGTFARLPSGGVCVTVKLAEALGVTVGDAVEVWLPGDNEPVYLPVTAVLDVTIGQSLYMLRDDWEALRKGEFLPTALLLRSPTEMCRHELEESDSVTALHEPTEQYAQAMTLMDSTKAVFSLMYGAALGLAFVISYNMGLMNFSERIRDYATLKVLGYHQKEIRRLMMRENDLITLGGAALGIVPGFLLTSAVLGTVSSETMVWTAHVAPFSVALATIITCAFSILIEFVLTRKVRSIDMVEALKSVE